MDVIFHVFVYACDLVNHTNLSGVNPGGPHQVLEILATRLRQMSYNTNALSGLLGKCNVPSSSIKISFICLPLLITIFCAAACTFVMFLCVAMLF